MKNGSCLLMVVLLAASAAHAAAGPGKDAAETRIRAALAGWVEAANRGDYEAALSVWAPDLIGWPPDGPDDSYARELAGAKQAPAPMRTTYALAIDEIIVEGSLAVVRDTWTQTRKQAGGGATIAQFRSFEVWRRQADGDWKISRWIDGPPLPAGQVH